MEKYRPSRVVLDFVFLSQKRGCIRCISLQVYNKISRNILYCTHQYFSDLVRVIFHADQTS